MKKIKGYSGIKPGILFLILSLVILPHNFSLSLAADVPVFGPSTERENGTTVKDTKPDAPEPTPVERTETVAKEGNAGPGAAKDVKSKKWWWIGGGVVAIVAIVAAAGGGGGGGGGSTASH